MGAKNRAARTWWSSAVVIAAVWSVWIVGQRPEALPPGVERLELPAQRGEPLRHWVEQGYVRLTPPVHLPSSSPVLDQVEIWAKLPREGSIGVVDGPDGPTLRFAPGTSIDRIELWREGASRRIVDVRGTTVEPDGTQRYHVLRPDGNALFGYAWPAEDAAAHRAVTEAMQAALAQTRELEALAPHVRRRELQAFETKNDCGSCHAPLQPTAVSVEERLVRRGTDGSGFYVPATVLIDSVVLEGYGRHDLNPRQEHMSVSCPGGASPEIEGPRPQVRCPGAGVPRAQLDLRAALHADVPLASAVCRSRAAIHAAMDDAARQRFASAFDRCDIGPSAVAWSSSESL